MTIYLILVSKIKSDLAKAGISYMSSEIYKKMLEIENRLNRTKVKRSVPKKIVNDGESS